MTSEPQTLATTIMGQHMMASIHGGMYELCLTEWSGRQTDAAQIDALIQFLTDVKAAIQTTDPEADPTEDAFDDFDARLAALDDAMAETGQALTRLEVTHNLLKADIAYDHLHISEGRCQIEVYCRRFKTLKRQLERAGFTDVDGTDCKSYRSSEAGESWNWMALAHFPVQRMMGGAV